MQFRIICSDFGAKIAYILFLGCCYFIVLPGRSALKISDRDAVEDIARHLGIFISRLNVCRVLLNPARKPKVRALIVDNASKELVRVRVDRSVAPMCPEIVMSSLLLLARFQKIQALRQINAV